MLLLVMNHWMWWNIKSKNVRKWDLRVWLTMMIFVGVESADNQIKENIHKGTTIEQDTAVLEWCKELGVRCKMSFILGLPGESLESMQNPRDWIFKNSP